MAIRLDIVDPGDPGAAHSRSFVQDRVIIGRARSCDVCLPDMAVSTRHAEIRLDGNDYKAVDLGSLNGTFIAGQRLVPHRARRLSNEDMIDVAGFEIRFRLGVAPGPPAGRDEAAIQARAILAGLLARSGERPPPSLLVIGGPGPASRYPLPEPPAALRIGRANDADICVDDRDVSRYHAEVVRTATGIAVRDIESRNGLIVGGERVAEAEIAPGVPFTVGGTTFALEHPADVALAAIQSAPEEETSSFAPPRRTAAGHDAKDAQVSAKTPEASAEAPEASAKEPLPIGPEDPLSYPGQPGYQRTTREIPRPDPPPGRGDLGLIVVGAILLVAAVVALALLLT
ncbi:MAG: FHA domain-containing protein [Proteobacteria bacterium]|jgi:pSer/pThr/pTyr-binding forkhead associated (FHA) protein|nr:FHA domain-containing protein [Pseudomonadota bacterium]